MKIDDNMVHGDTDMKEPAHVRAREVVDGESEDGRVDMTVDNLGAVRTGTARVGPRARSRDSWRGIRGMVDVGALFVAAHDGESVELVTVRQKALNQRSPPRSARRARRSVPRRVSALSESRSQSWPELNIPPCRAPTALTQRRPCRMAHLTQTPSCA